MGKLILLMPNPGTLARQVLDHYRKIGARGATVDEAAAKLGLLHQRVSPMVSALKISGLLEPKGKATRLSDCNCQMTVYILAARFEFELREAGYAVKTHCQCKLTGCAHFEDTCENSPTELIETNAGITLEMCLECAVVIPSGVIRASRFIKEKQ